MKLFILLIFILLAGCANFRAQEIPVEFPEKMKLYCVGGEGVWSSLKVRDNTLLTRFSSGEDFEPEADPYLEPLILLKSYARSNQTTVKLKSREREPNH